LLLGSARGCGLIVTLVRQKILAIVLGRAGLGVLALLRQFLDPLIQILPLGVNAGVVKFVAQHRRTGDEAELRRTVSTAAWFFLSISSAAALVVLYFSQPLAIRILGAGAYRRLIVLAALSVPMTILAAYFNALLVGAQRIGTITRIHYLGHAVTLVVNIPLIILYGLTGAVAALAILEVFYCFAYGICAARYVPVNLRSFAARTLFRLSSYGIATLADTGLWMLALFFVRVDFSRRFGDETQGLYEIIYRLSFNYLAILVYAINTYVFPRVSALENDEGLGGEINVALRGVWLLMIPAVMALSITIKPVIWLFSTAQFYDGAAFLPWQLVGDVFYMCWVTLGLGLLGRGRLKAFILAGVARSAVFVAAYTAIEWFAGLHSLNFFPTIPQSLRRFSGWQGLVWAYALGGFSAALIAYAALKKLYGFRLSRENRLLVLFSTFVMLPVLFVPNLGPLWIGAKIAALAVWVATVVSKTEWAQGIRWIGEMVSRK